MTINTLGDIWRGIDKQKLEDYYWRLLEAHSSCDSCWATRWCSGQCPQYLCHDTGRVYPPDQRACDSTKRYVERNLAVYEMLSEEGVDWIRLRREVGE